MFGSMAKNAVIVLDMLNDFVTGEIANERAENIIPPLRDVLLPSAREHNQPVIYANDSHIAEDTELEVWGEHAMRGTEGAEVIPQLEPQDQDHIVDKRFYDAFYQTGLDELLRSLDVDTIVPTGMHTNMCARHTSAAAFFRGYDILAPRDCLEAFSQEEHEDGLDYLQDVYQAEITTADDLVRRFEASSEE